VARCTAVSHGAWCRSAAHSLTHSHTHAVLRDRPEWRSHTLPRECQEKKGSISPARGCKNAASRRPRKPREKLGSISPQSLRERPITRGHSPENAPRKNGQHFPLRSGVKKPAFPALPGTRCRKFCSISPSAVQQLTVVVAGGDWPRAAPPNPTPGSADQVAAKQHRPRTNQPAASA
jgi:hypothetical protein